MPINTDLNVSPYFDDYDETKNYHRILFRPSVPIQARELTQLQTILQNQIEKFGNWAFNNGDIVDGCTTYDIPVLPYIRLKNFASNSTSNSVSFVATDQIGRIVVSQTTGLEAEILYANSGFETNYPDTNIFYLKYRNTGTGGQKIFSNNELLRIKTVTNAGNTWIANIYSYANSATNHVTSGNAHGISVSEGTIFINGNFVRVSNSTVGIVNKHDTYAGNNVVGFILEEKIITENDDETLTDNALGYPNENAPGAHRLKLIPRIISLSEEDSQNTASFNPIGRYNYGSYVVKSGPTSANLYSIVGDVVAKRTYEESGNYVVNPFSVDSITNSGDVNVAPENANCFFGRVSPGVGYAQGKRVELLKTSYVNMRRGVDTKTYDSQQITFAYGGYFVLTQVAGTFDFTKAETVYFYDAPQTAISDRHFSAFTPAGNQIGSAKVRCFSYNSGNPGTKDAQYILHVFQISMNTGYNTNQIKSVYYVNGSIKGVGDVFSNGLVDAGNKLQLYSFGYPGIKNLRDVNGNLNSLYDYRTKVSNTVSTLGNVTVVLTNGNEELPYGIAELPDSEAANFTIVVTANTDTAQLTGTVNVNTSSVNVIGGSASLDLNFLPGEQIKVISGATEEIRTVTSVVNASFMTIDAPMTSITNSSAAFKKTFLQGKILPISKYSAGINSYVDVTSANTFTIHTGQAPATNMPVDIYFNVRKIDAVPAKKEIKKGRFVKISTSSNPNGPWCLGFSDVHKITAIYANTGSVTNTSPNVIDNFTYNTGQTDTHYGLAYLYPKGGYDTTNLNLLVQLDYFSANLSTGVGFFTIESYPIDDANTANTTAIQTKDIPLYVSEAGNKIPLRDVIDFRTPANNTATDTTDYTTASTNPSSTLVFKIDSLKGLQFPAYGKNFQSDYTRYLPRKDLIMITPDNILKVKEGASSDIPQTPLMPENAMPIAVVNVPPYPSLTSDQVDEFLSLNQKAKSLIRDTSVSITSGIITNRRYTMRDIGKLDDRITNLEYYTQLSLLEKQAKDLTVTDGNGLDRFKNGIFVDPYTDSSLGDVSNPEYSIAIDASKGVARPKIIREVFKIKFDNGASSNVQVTGRLITLGYQEIPFITQPYATKYRNSALVAYAWNGRCILVPCYDNHQDVNNTGSLNITIDNTTPWKDFASSPMALTWGDWRTTTSTTSNTVVTGTAQTINFTATKLVGYGAKYQQGSAQYQAAIIAAVQKEVAAAGIDPNLVVGNLTVNQTWIPGYGQNATYYY